MKNLFHTFYFVLLTTIVHAQSYNIPATPLLRYLYNYNKSINTISNTTNEIYLTKENSKLHGYQKLIKSNDGLFITIDGTGIVFKATGIDLDSIKFTRIDSTKQLGNTYSSIDFIYNDTLYSFGGYGFWHRNGQLRRFNSSKEWSIEKIYNLRKTMNFIYNYLPKKSRLYYIEAPYKEEETFSEKVEFSAIKFDLKSKTNTFLGNINSKIKLLTDNMIDIPNLNGTLINTNRGLLLLDFEQNKVFKVINKNITDALIDKSDLIIQNTFVNQDSIYYTNYPDTNLKSTKISKNDFLEEPYVLYINESNKISSLTILLVPLFLLLIVIVILSLKKFTFEILNFKNTFKNSDENSFSLIEKNLIENLIKKSIEGSYFTVDDINVHLGTKNKPIDVQKNIRTETINRINYKFNHFCKTDKVLIQRERSSDDARFMNYFIDSQSASIFKKFIK